MKTTYSALRLVALLCVAMVLLACLAQPTLGLLFLFLIPFWFFLAGCECSPSRRYGCMPSSSFSVPACFLASPAPPPLDNRSRT